MGMQATGAPFSAFNDAGAQRGGASSPGEGWTCDKCGNHNYENRMYCNKRTCGNPGPWTCPLCNNKNFAKRMTCNMKKCGAPRPPPPPNAGPLATTCSPIG